MKIEEIEKLCDRATSGPWYVGARDMTKHTVGPLTETVASLDFEYGDDADFIAALNPETVKKLLAIAKAAEDLSHYGNCDREHGDPCGHCGIIEALAALESEP